MNWFTSDLHLGDDRMNLYARDMFFKNYEDFETTLFKNWNDSVKEDDTVYVLGDIAFDASSCLKMTQLKGKKILIRGNYDRDDMTAKPNVTQHLSKVFYQIYDDIDIELNGILLHLTHFPTDCVNYSFNITGHIHGLWRVQRNMINVGIDAWNYRLIDENRLMFFYNAIKKFYNKNVFAGELSCNLEINY